MEIEMEIKIEIKIESEIEIEIERGTRAFRRCALGISDQGSSSVILQGYIQRLACAYS